MVLKRNFGVKIQECSFRWELNSAEFFYFYQKRIWATVEFTARYPFAPLSQLLKKQKLDEYSRPMDNNNLFFGELYLRNLLLDARSVKNICYWKLIKKTIRQVSSTVVKARAERDFGGWTHTPRYPTTNALWVSLLVLYECMQILINVAIHSLLKKKCARFVSWRGS